MSNDRRRSARVEILGRVRGHAVLLDTAVIVRDISLVGMAIETPFEFALDTVHDFRLTLGDGAHVVLQARARHSRLLTGADDTANYLTGFEFIDDDAAEGTPSVGDFVNRIR